jgi:flagellar motility protein MotE (MotC chaperone)
VFPASDLTEHSFSILALEGFVLCYANYAPAPSLIIALLACAALLLGASIRHQDAEKTKLKQLLSCEQMTAKHLTNESTKLGHEVDKAKSKQERQLEKATAHIIELVIDKKRLTKELAKKDEEIEKHRDDYQSLSDDLQVLEMEL